MIGLNFQNFVSAAVGIVVLFALIRGFVREGEGTGKLLHRHDKDSPLHTDSAVSGISCCLPGCSADLKQYDEVQLVEPVVVNRGRYRRRGHKGVVPLGPAASQIAIKQLNQRRRFLGQQLGAPFENPHSVIQLI